MAPFSPLPPRDEESLPVRRGRVDSVDVFEVKEGELEKIESGLKDTPLDLSYASILLSSGLTCIGSLATSDFKSEMAKFLYISIAFFGPVFSMYFFFRWRNKRSSSASVIDTIKKRIEPRNGDSKERSSDEDIPSSLLEEDLPF